MPAAAVIRGEQALSGMIGRKASVGGLESPLSNPKAQPWSGSGVLLSLSMVEVEGTPSVTVKCVDFRENTRGEGALLGQKLTLRDES